MADDRARRKQLAAEYKQTHPEAGVYRIVNTQNNNALLGSTPNLASIRNKLAFARSTNSPGALDYRLTNDIRQFGLDAFSFEVLDVLESRPEMTASDIRAELGALEALWRKKQDLSLLY